jgi:hypothetical protein
MPERAYRLAAGRSPTAAGRQGPGGDPPAARHYPWAQRPRHEQTIVGRLETTSSRRGFRT